jgi:FlaG protein
MTPIHMQRQDPVKPGFDSGITNVMPAEARRAVDQTTAGTDALLAAQRQLHFEVNKDTGRMEIELRDLEGNVLRRIPPGEALDFLARGGA